MAKYKSPGRREMRAKLEARWVWISRGPTRVTQGTVVSNNRAARRAAR